MQTAALLTRAVCVTAFMAAGSASHAERLVQSSTEMRTYIYLQVAENKLEQILPKEWALNPGTKLLQGANVALVFIEGLAATDADNKPIPFHDSYVVVGVLAKHAQSGVSTFMVVDGLVPPSQATPGPYGAYTTAKVAMSKQVEAKDGQSNRREAWSFTTDSGERLSFSTEYQLGIGTKSHMEPRVYSGIRPDFYRIYKADLTSDTVHSITPEGKKATSVSFSASGPRLGRLFDGSEKIIGVVAVPAYQRAIYLPD
ncbi:hypothetical protein ACRAWG_08625 [Methylobacterium sp. P31]